MLASQREHRPHREPRDPLELVDLLEVLRLGHRDGQLVADLEHRDAAQRSALAAASSRTASGSIKPSRSRIAGTPSCCSMNGSSSLFADEAQLEQRFAQPLAVLRLAAPARLQLFLRR